jgi:hypothetical protein
MGIRALKERGGKRRKETHKKAEEKRSTNAREAKREAQTPLKQKRSTNAIELKGEAQTPLNQKRSTNTIDKRNTNAIEALEKHFEKMLCERVGALLQTLLTFVHASKKVLPSEMDPAEIRLIR